MDKVAEAVGPDAFLALGDTHHYLGISSVDDPLRMTNYEPVYSHPELQVEWCPVLGNHEYRGNTQAVIDYSGISRRWMMPSRYYTRIFDNDGTRVKVVFIDTTPIIDKYHSNTGEYPDANRQESKLSCDGSTMNSAVKTMPTGPLWQVITRSTPRLRNRAVSARICRRR